LLSEKLTFWETWFYKYNWIANNNCWRVWKSTFG